MRSSETRSSFEGCTHGSVPGRCLVCLGSLFDRMENPVRLFFRDLLFREKLVVSDSKMARVAAPVTETVFAITGKRFDIEGDVELQRYAFDSAHVLPDEIHIKGNLSLSDIQALHFARATGGVLDVPGEITIVRNRFNVPVDRKELREALLHSAYLTGHFPQLT